LIGQEKYELNRIDKYYRKRNYVDSFKKGSDMLNPPPKLVVFDLYGTLIKFGTTHHPFRKILKWAHVHGRKPLETDPRFLMTRNEEPEAIFCSMGIVAPDEMLQMFQKEIHEELDSLTLFDDVTPTLEQLAEAKIDLAICSNLAKPYGAIIDRLLPDFSFARILSYEVGYLKPDDGIYDAILNRTGHRKESVLFTGDTFIADYEGPIRYGFHARHLCRTQGSHDQSIQSLKDILRLLS
jgi:HAD superfamily hydrolase (TIGR01549 family)